MTSYITSILGAVGDFLGTLYATGEGATVTVLGTIAMLPIVSGVIGVVVSVVRRGRG